MKIHYTIRGMDNIDKPLSHLVYLGLVLFWETYQKPLYGLILAYILGYIFWPVELNLTGG